MRTTGRTQHDATSAQNARPEIPGTGCLRSPEPRGPRAPRHRFGREGDGGLWGFVVGRCASSEARELVAQQCDAVAFGSGRAALALDRVDRSEVAVLETPAVPARFAQPVCLV